MKSLIFKNFLKIEELWTSYLIYFELSRFSAYGRSKDFTVKLMEISRRIIYSLSLLWYKFILVNNM